MNEDWQEYEDRLYMLRMDDARVFAASELLRGFGEHVGERNRRYVLARKLMWSYRLWWEDAQRVALMAVMLHWYKKLVGEV